jgi:GTP-binding protein
MALFVDITAIECKAGDGGNGCVSFHREKFVQAGGPDGGDGGRGGDIVFMASHRLNTLMDFRYNRKFYAPNGENGMNRRKSGKSGECLVIEVPVGTVVRDSNSNRVLLDMSEPGAQRVLRKGGNGGFGNARFATPTRQAPNFAKPGAKTEPIEIKLELKSIADIGLIGLPNVGKSTLLAAVTSARPKIADYHFTTLIPNLGIVRQDDMDFIIADIPGLVEGAAEGIGLGHDFLRHIERTRLLIHVIDISGFEGRDPLDDHGAIMGELSKYGDLAARPMIVAANKSDLPGSDANAARLRDKLRGCGTPVFSISAAARRGLNELMRAAAAMLITLPRPEPFAEEGLPEDVVGDEYIIAHTNGIYDVSGAGVERLLGSVNFNDHDSLNWFHRALRKRGVIDLLREAGAREGDTVIMGNMEFDYVE